MSTAILQSRSVISISGLDAVPFLQGLITADLSALSPTHPLYGALLTPQGKVVADMFVYTQRTLCVGTSDSEARSVTSTIEREHSIVENPEDFDGVLLDIWSGFKDELLRRLSLYKMRAQVEIVDASAMWDVVVEWEESGFDLPQDPRTPSIGYRGIVAKGLPLLPSPLTGECAPIGADEGEYGSFQNHPHPSLRDTLSRQGRGEVSYHTHLCRLGIAQAGLDFGSNEVFVHDINLDLMGGVAFTKGCYIGQEVVSRVHHKAVVRTRTVAVEFEGEAPHDIQSIMAGPIEIGTIGARFGTHATARLRIDRAQEAGANGLKITCGGIKLRIPHNFS